jgi:hypothetical protein
MSCVAEPSAAPPMSELGDGDSVGLAILEPPTQRPHASSLCSTAQLHPPSWLMT